MKSINTWASSLIATFFLAITVSVSAAPTQRPVEEPRGEIMSPDKAQSLIPYAFASQLADTYKLNCKKTDHSTDGKKIQKYKALHEKLDNLQLTPLKAKDLPSSVQELFTTNETERFATPYSGLQARAFFHRDRKNIILSLAGTDFHPMLFRTYATMSSANLIAYGYSTPMLTYASQICRALKDMPGIESITVTGNSLGGAVAHYAGLACGAKAIAFNSLALPENLRLQAMQEYLDYRDTEQTPSTSHPVQVAITAYKQLELIEVEGEALNNSKGLLFIQGQHPESTSIQLIPAHNKNLGSVGRHWTPTVVKSLEAHTTKF